jgi:hypothetical protein
MARWRMVALGAALVAGAGLVGTSGGIHLYLWIASYYRFVPVIGPLFLFQSVTAFAVAIIVLLSRRFVVVMAAAGFLVATIGGYLLTVYVGLFGFRDTLAAHLGQTSLIVEAVGFAVLVLAGALIPARDRWHLPWR